jgi:hypothetical protein
VHARDHPAPGGGLLDRQRERVTGPQHGFVATPVAVGWSTPALPI